MIPMKYINLRALIEQGAGVPVVDLLKAALAALPRGMLFVTLDLGAAKDLYREDEVAHLVRLIHERWPPPACCLARCDHPLAWSRAAASLSQPLLSWRALVKQGGYTVLGQAPRGSYAQLLRALCLTHEEASAEQLANDATIISPRKMNFDYRSMQRWLQRGIPRSGQIWLTWAASLMIYVTWRAPVTLSRLRPAASGRCFPHLRAASS